MKLLKLSQEKRAKYICRFGISLMLILLRNFKIDNNCHHLINQLQVHLCVPDELMHAKRQ